MLEGGDFASYFADDVLWTTMEDGAQVQGRDAVRDLIATMHTQAFDASPELRTLVCGDGIAAVEAVLDATQVTESVGIPSTGAHVRIPYTMFYDVDGGKITRLRAYLSMAALAAQLQPATAAASASASASAS